jgi:hypothetical protein
VSFAEPKIEVPIRRASPVRPPARFPDSYNTQPLFSCGSNRQELFETLRW